jgi:hypothetical protein
MFVFGILVLIGYSGVINLKYRNTGTKILTGILSPSSYCLMRVILRVLLRVAILVCTEAVIICSRRG